MRRNYAYLCRHLSLVVTSFLFALDEQKTVPHEVWLAGNIAVYVVGFSTSSSIVVSTDISIQTCVYTYVA